MEFAQFLLITDHGLRFQIPFHDEVFHTPYYSAPFGEAVDVIRPVHQLLYYQGAPGAGIVVADPGDQARDFTVFVRSHLR